VTFRGVVPQSRLFGKFDLPNAEVSETPVFKEQIGQALETFRFSLGRVAVAAA
jgi:hypothetical protein